MTVFQRHGSNCSVTGILRNDFPAPWARHICRNENQNVFSSVLVAPQPEAKADRSGIFRRNDFQKMPLLTELFAIGEIFYKDFAPSGA